MAEVEKVLGKEQAAKNNAGTLRVSEYIARETFTHDCFDMLIDTGALSPSEVAHQVIDRVKNGTPGTSMQRLAVKFGI